MIRPSMSWTGAAEQSPTMQVNIVMFRPHDLHGLIFMDGHADGIGARIFRPDRTRS